MLYAFLPLVARDSRLLMLPLFTKFGNDFSSFGYLRMILYAIHRITRINKMEIHIQLNHSCPTFTLHVQIP